MKHLNLILFCLLLSLSMKCFSQAYSFKCEQNTSGAWYCSSTEDLNNPFIYLSGEKNKTLVFHLDILVQIKDSPNKFEQNKKYDTKIYLSNGEVLSLSAEYWISRILFSTHVIKSNKKQIDETNYGSYVTSQLRKFNITKIVFGGLIINTPNFRSAATIDAMCKTLITKTGDQGQYGSSGSVGNSTTTKSSAPRADFKGTRIVSLAPVPGHEVEIATQCNVTVYNAKGKEIHFVTCFDGPNRGVGLKNYGVSNQYNNTSGNVVSYVNVTCNPEWEGTNWNMLTTRIPLSELHLPDGSQTLNIRWFAFLNGQKIGDSEFQTVHFVKNGASISNFYVEGGEATSGYYSK